MNSRRLAGVAAALAIATVLPLTVAHPAAASAPAYDTIVFAGPPSIAQPGSLVTGSTVTFCIQAKTGGASGTPVPGAQIFLSMFSGVFTVPSAPGGSAAVGSTALTTSPASFTVGATCTDSALHTFPDAITVTYTAPSPVPSNGRDIVYAAQVNSTGPSCTPGSVCNTDVYVFSPVASFAFSVGSSIAPSGILALGQLVTFTVTALDNSSPANPVPGDMLLLSITSTGLPHGSASATDSTGTSSLVAANQHFTTDSNGTVPITYTASNPLPVSGVDTVFARAHPSSGPTASTAYIYAFHPHGVGAPATAVTPDGSAQLIFWKGSDNFLAEAWYTTYWNGPVEYPNFGALSSAPTVAVTRDGTAQLVFWEGAGGHLFEAWYANGWNGPVDWTAAWGGRGLLGSAPSVATMSNGTQLVFWRGTDGHLWEAWYANGWNGPVDYTTLGTLASAPSVALTPGDASQVVFWRGTDNVLSELWYTSSWNGPVKWSQFASMNSAPSVAITSTGVQLVFYQGPSGHLEEGWFTTSWNGPADWTAGPFHGAGALTSPPSAMVTPNGAQVIFWEGAGSSLWEAWYSGGWNGPVDYSG